MAIDPTELEAAASEHRRNFPKIWSWEAAVKHNNVLISDAKEAARKRKSALIQKEKRVDAILFEVKK